MTEIAIAVACENLLGECANWHGGERALYWTDVEGKRLWRLEPASGASRSWPTPDRAGSFAIAAGGGFVLALPDRLVRWYPPADGTPESDTGTTHVLVQPMPGQAAGTRLNDGRCDRQGRFVVGGFDETTRQPVAGVWRLELDGTVTRLIETGVTCNNSICFTADGGTMYFADSPTGMIWAYDYDPAPGAPLGPRRDITDGAGQPGKPDGSAVDAEGYLWNAQVFGGRVVRYAPDGRVDRVIELPCRCPTSVAFGGPALDVLYVTSLRRSKALPDWQPGEADGALLALDPGVRGLPETPSAIA